MQWLILALALSPLQKAEQNLTPRLLEMFKKDHHFRYVNFWLVIFALASYGAALDFIFLGLLKKNIVLAIWIILLGISIDLINHLFKRISGYFNPFVVVELFAHEAKESIQDEREIDLCGWIDALTEVSLKAIQRSSVSLSNKCIDEIQMISKTFLESSKSISHHEQDSQTKALGITDKVSYTLFYLFQRLEFINNTALEKRIETIGNSLIAALGKISIYAAKYDLSISSYPIHYLGKFAESWLQKNFLEVGVKATLTMLEVSKVIINEVDVTYSDLKDPFLSIISHLEEIAKETFRKDKKTSIQVLTQPFRDLKFLFNNEKVSSHQDTPVIIQNIDRVLAEFETLETVLKTMPPIPNIPENVSSAIPTE